LSVTPCSLE